MAEGGEAILFEKDTDLWLQPIGSSAPARALYETPYHEHSARVSPDQRWIALTSDESGQDEVYVRPFPAGEGKWQVSIGGGHYPRWLPGSDGLMYLAGNEVFLVRAPQNDFEHARPEHLMTFPEGLRYIELMPDGLRFLGIRTVPTTPSSGRVECVVNWTTELEARLPRSGG